MLRGFQTRLAIMAAVALVVGMAMAQELVSPRREALPPRASPQEPTLAPPAILAPGTRSVLPQESAGETDVLFQQDGVFVGPNMLVTVGPQNDRVFAFSKETGTWRKAQIAERQAEPIVPQITQQLVFFQAGRQLWAYSAPRGEWQVHDVERGVRVEMQIHDDFAWCRVGPRLIAYSARANRWETVDVDR